MCTLATADACDRSTIDFDVAIDAMQLKSCAQGHSAVMLADLHLRSISL